MDTTMRKMAGIMTAGVLLLGLSGCGNSTASPDSSTPTTLHMSWANASDTVEGMAANSDAVAQITIKSVAGTGVDKDLGDGAPYTLFTAKVERWMKGTGDTQITIKQTGSASVQVEDDPLLEVGEVAVVFLHEFADGRYFIVGGPTGRFHLDVHDNLVPLPGGILRDTGPAAGLADQLSSS